MRIGRRSFLGAAAGVVATAGNRWAAEPSLPANVVREWSFQSDRKYGDPFNELELDVEFSGPDGETLRVPAFWAGGSRWKVRFAHPVPGRWCWRSSCSRPEEMGLHGRTGSFEIVPYRGENRLLQHGPVRISPGGRQFQHADGTPFFFLADDWWLGLSARLRFPEEFLRLTRDRARKGFTVVKLTAGLNTDTTEFDPRSANEGGQPWEPGYARIRPEFFDGADRRITLLIEQGLSPSIVGSWGFYLKSLGIRKMCQHWRYCVARWGASPVTWYLTVENDLPYYLSSTRKEDTERAQREWTEVGRYLRSVDPFRRPVSMQSWSTRDSALGGLREPGILDFDSLHMGHRDLESAQLCAGVVRKLWTRTPAMPVVPGEVAFEGIGWQNWQNIQRLCFWGSLLNGASGFCYGANGIWQFNRPGEPFGDSPHRRTWGGDTWEMAMHYPGSAQVGIAKQFLCRFPFWRIEPHPEWIELRPREKENLPPFAAGIPGELRLIYLSFGAGNLPSVRYLEPGQRYHAYWLDPVSGKETPIGEVKGDQGGSWQVPQTPGYWDFLLVLENRAWVGK